jgi:hypothetical protein
VEVVVSKKKGFQQDIRLLRGDELAQHLVNLNGHQRRLRVIYFEPYWLAMIIFTLPFLSMIGILKSVFWLGWLGLLFETILWVYFGFKHRDISAYPGLEIWWRQFMRHTLMVNGRPGGDHSRPL